MKFHSALPHPFRKLKRTQKKIAKWLEFVQKVKPVGTFEELHSPTPPDYGDWSNWAARPGVPNKSSLTPKGFSIQAETTLADVFFIHPTTYFGAESWNAPLKHPLSKQIVDEIILPGQASAFNARCRIFAPRYRQATFFSFLEASRSGRKAFELAYSDIASAFDIFIRQLDEGRPFFIASHSQGTLHAIRLLEEKIENSEIRKQLVSAYVIGYRFPLDKFGTAFKNLKPCESPLDTGCIINWDTYEYGGKPAQRLELAEHWYRSKDGKSRWVGRSRKMPLCVNPLTWQRALGMAPKTQHRGAVRILFDNIPFRWEAMWGNKPLQINAVGLSSPFTEEVSAEIRKDGFLYISKPKTAAFRTILLPRKNYHLQDYALFYMNIRENVEERLRAFLAKN